MRSLPTGALPGATDTLSTADSSPNGLGQYDSPLVSSSPCPANAPDVPPGRKISPSLTTSRASGIPDPDVSDPANPDPDNPDLDNSAPAVASTTVCPRVASWLSVPT